MYTVARLLSAPFHRQLELELTYFDMITMGNWARELEVVDLILLIVLCM